MSIKTYFDDLYDFNYWANHRYLKAAEALTKEQLFRKQGHSIEELVEVGNA